MDPVFPDKKAVAQDEELAATRTVRVLSPFARYVPFVDVAQAGIKADLPGTTQRRDRSAGLVGQAVGGVKLGHVPRGLNSHLFGDEPGNPFKFLLGVVVLGNNEGGDLQPDPQPLVFEDGVEDFAEFRMDDLPVKLFREAFQVDIGGIEIGADLGQGRGSDVAVSHENVLEPRVFGKDRGVVGIFIEDGGLRVGIGDR